MTSRSRMRIWRKRLTRAILCLLLGAVTTVGVAWGIAYQPRYGDAAREEYYDAERRTYWLRWRFDGWTHIALYPAATGSHEPYRALPGWSKPGELTARVPAERQPVAEIDIDGFGVPAICLASATIDDGETIAHLWSVHAFDQDLPTRIFTPGLLFDTLFYAAPWWLILITPGVIRRFRRRRRGRCINCGYDLSGLPAGDNTTPTCPECGA